VTFDDGTHAAIAALAHRVRERDAAAEKTPADVFAAEFLVALRGQGWRQTAAVRPGELWKSAVAHDGVQAGEAYRLARVHIDRWRHGIRCEVCCPCLSCVPPYEVTACKCEAPCDTATCGARHHQVGGAA
jgi:hypothetical protein